jgi:hypothetical protein
MQGEAMEGVRGEVVEGLRYVHYQLGANTGKVLEVSSFLYALTELLIERGIITEKELNERKIAVAKRLVKKFKELGMGAVFQEKEQDKRIWLDFEHKVINPKLPEIFERKDEEGNVLK